MFGKMQQITQPVAVKSILKNRFIESQKTKAKLYHCNHHGDQFDEGVLFRRTYDEIKATSFSYWDDAQFIINDYRVSLWWVHPRRRFLDLVEQQAFDVTPSPLPAFSIFDNSTTNYKIVGRSRKKIAGYTMAPIPPVMKQYFDDVELAEINIIATATIEVRPTMLVKWYGNCKGIDLCVPFEVHNRGDLKQLVALTRKLLTRETTLQREFGDYTYSNIDWLREHELTENREWVAVPRVGKELI